MKDLLSGGAVIIIILMFVFYPFLLIWGINELSEQGGLSFQLPYNFWAWLSCLAIAAVIKGASDN